MLEQSRDYRARCADSGLTPLDRLLTVDEVGAYTRECRAATYKRLKKGELNGVKIGVRTYIRTGEVMRYLNSLKPYRNAMPANDK